MLPTEKRAAYRQFCQENKLPIFVQDWYLDAVTTSGSWDAAIVKEDGEIAGILPYFLKQKYGFSYITMPVGVKYMGPYLAAAKNNLSDQHQLYDQLLQQLPAVDSFWQNFHPNCTNWLPFYWSGYQQTTRYTYRLDISAPEKVFRDFSDKTRYKLRKARKIVRIVRDLSPEAFHAVHIMSFERQGLPSPLSEAEFIALHQLLSEHQAGQMFFAIDDAQNIHAVLYILLEGETAYMHFLGSNPEFPKSEAVNFMYWEVFQYLSQEKGIKIVDFQGGMMKNVENIFRRLRAKQTPYFSITREPSKVFKWLQKLKT